MSTRVDTDDTKMSTGEARIGLRRARDVAAGSYGVAEPLFDCFWRTGELALCFGEPGIGMSVLAVQLADGLARGAETVVGGQCSVAGKKAADN